MRVAPSGPRRAGRSSPPLDPLDLGVPSAPGGDAGLPPRVVADSAAVPGLTGVVLFACGPGHAACEFHAGPAQAQVEVPDNWELKPSGLQVGDEFRLLLRTKNPHHATSTDISVYDAHVQSQVATRGHGALKEYSAHFKILGSTATVDARTHNGMSGSGGVPLYWVNGAKVADDNDDFFDGSWTSKTSGRGVDGRLLGGGASNQSLCTGSADNGTATNLPLGGGGDPDGNGTSECTATSVNTSSSTLGGRTLEVDARTRYLALSGVFRVADSTRPRVESDLIRMRTREGMAIARAKGKLRGRQPKLSDRQAGELRRMHDTGDYSVSDLAAVCSVSRPTVYRTLRRGPAAA